MKNRPTTMRGSVQQGLKQKRTYKQHLQMYAVAHTEKQQNKNIFDVIYIFDVICCTSQLEFTMFQYLFFYVSNVYSSCIV